MLMNLDPAAFIVHDISEFPLAFFRNETMLDGYSDQWKRELSGLIAHNVPFVILHVQIPDMKRWRWRNAVWRFRSETIGRTGRCAMVSSSQAPDVFSPRSGSSWH